MKAIDIKTELLTLIENETDNGILESIKAMLQKSSLNPELKEKLSSRALKSEEDIAAGRVMSREELEEKLNERLGL